MRNHRLLLAAAVAFITTAIALTAAPLAARDRAELAGPAFSRAGDGRYHADFEFGAMVYNADGDLVNTASMHVRPVLTAAAYQAMLKDGAKAYQKIDVPAHGDSTLRIGVHDLTSDHVGALEVPTSAIAAAR